MTGVAERVILSILRGYVSIFAYFAPDFARAQLEHSLIEGSVRDYAASLISSGVSPGHAFAQSLWRHVGELAPITLLAKTYTDSAAGSRSGAMMSAWYILRLSVPLSGVLLIAVWTAVSSAPAVEGEWVRVGAGPVSESPTVLGSADSLRELLYRATGVCLDPIVTDADLTEDLVKHGSPDADCSDLDR